MNLRIVFKFKDCKLQFYEKWRLFSYFIVNPRTSVSRWRRLLKLKRININSYKIIVGFFSPHRYSWPQRSPFRLFTVTRLSISNANKNRWPTADQLVFFVLPWVNFALPWVNFVLPWVNFVVPWLFVLPWKLWATVLRCRTVGSDSLEGCYLHRKRSLTGANH